MAQFITTVGTSHYIEQIIINATTNLTLVTPYLSLSKNLLERLLDADKQDVKITLIYGKSELTPKEQKKIDSIKNMEIFFCKNLHAKCYLNDESLIITSMNLYEFSERHNREMGILVEKETDSKIFSDTLKEIESIKNSSEIIKPFKAKEVKKIAKTTTTTRIEKVENKNSLIYLSKNNNNNSYFYQPSLYRVLKEKLKNVNINAEGTIKIDNYPFYDSEITIFGSINFKFKDENFYTFFKNNYKDKVKESEPSIRYYFNYILKVYLEKEFASEESEEGLNIIVEKYLRIIDNTVSHINIAKKEYDKL